MINKTIDETRLINTKKIQLDYYFYVLFRNILKKILVNNQDLKKNIEEILNNWDLVYNEKLDNLYNLLIKIMEKYVNFEEFIINDVIKLSNCLEIDNNNCLKNQKCVLSDEKKCKTIFPKKSF